MPRFFTEHIAGNTALVRGEDARHIAKALRMQPGEELTLCDGRGADYRCKITAVSPEEVEARVLERGASESEPAVRLVLYQALPKGDKLDFIVQKAVELGAAEIVPVLTERCISRPDARSMEKKRARLQRIAAEAAKQSGRGRIPQIGALLPFREAVLSMKRCERAILLYEKADTPLSSMLGDTPASVGLLVGSEGGFSPEEAAFAAGQGVPGASLGRRILRCETAPVAALAVLLYAFGEMG